MDITQNLTNTTRKHIRFGKPRTTALQPWLWDITIREFSSHLSLSLQMGLSVVRGKDVHLGNYWGFP